MSIRLTVYCNGPECRASLETGMDDVSDAHSFAIKENWRLADPNAGQWEADADHLCPKCALTAEGE